MKSEQRSPGAWKPVLLLAPLLIALAAACTQATPTETPTPTATATPAPPSAEEARRAAPGTSLATLKAKGVIKNTSGDGVSSITIQTEEGATLTLTVNADTQFAINEPGLPNTRVGSFSDLATGATVEVEYTADGVALAILAGVAVPK